MRAEKTALSATKTDTPLLLTPQSVSVVSMEDMRTRSILSVGDALTYSAGVFANTKGATYGGDAIAIRGFGNDGTTGTAGNTYVDGLRLGGTGYVSGALDPYLYERVEVVKGPASVLYGQSVPGGLINMVSKRPKAEFSGEAIVRYGTFDRKQFALDVTGPVTERRDLLVRVTGTWFDTHDIYRFSGRKRVLFAPSLTWNLGDSTSLTVLTHYQKDDFAGSTLNWLPTIGTVIANPNGRVSRKLFTGDPNYQRWDRETASAGYQFEHRFSDWLSFRQNFRYTSTDLDNHNIYISRLSPDFRTAGRQAFGLREHGDDFTIDNNAAFTFATGAISHEVLAGLDWQSLKYETDRVFAVAPALDVFAPVYHQDIPEPAPFQHRIYRNRQTGLYLQDQVALGGWRLLLGLRQDWASFKASDLIYDVGQKSKNKALTKRAALLYAFDNGLSPYVSYSESFIPQYGADYDGNNFDPEKGRQLEAGVKFQPAGTASFLTASVFDLRRRNYLTADPNPEHAGFSVQNGEVRMRGLELEANVTVKEGLTLVGAYTLLDSRVTDSGDAVSGINPDTLAVESRDQQGLRLQAVPRHNASLWVNYVSPVGVALAGGVRYSSSTYGDAANLSRVPAFTLFDASVRFDLGQWLPDLQGLELSVKANNVFDKKYISSCVGIDRCYYGQARNVIADLAWRW
ncbi:TonB-dependent siderophore receptor [Novosphingobium beihaiensis]|uniref:TonB-dependent siderophore receptor n=1 Tax=Novosphingobium beihaiensis TaxID=2930389 RepID=A0ABT0BT93_9SPHN|nr:TonB-dependent siderophore receptor [Novosphingobium beihaiensis]MCJ2188278.1 TonB-dependent siderophore receptor [Novosphingobium beihaiensis]